MTNTKQNITEKGIKAQALMDKHATAGYRAAMQYAKVVEEAIKAEFFSDALEAKRMLAQARTLPGLFAKAAEIAAELHKSGTQLAIENEADLGSVSSVGGVPFAKRSGGMTTMGGGGR